MVARRSPRRLAAILATDVVGYSRLMRDDEAGTLNRLKALLSELIRPLLRTHGGRLVKTTGDGALIEFASAVDAVHYAVELQRELAPRNEPDGVPPGLQLRIGINLGDVVVEAGDLFGDGVNMAARLEALAEPGGICVSAMVYEAVRHKRTVEFVDLGQKMVKGFSEPIRVYAAAAAGEGELIDTATPLLALYAQPAIAVLPFDDLSGDPDHAHFADGLSEDIITALSLWRSFPVISRNSSFAYKGQARDVRKIATELGARYVLEGSVRRAGDRLRVTAQLIDASSGHHVWAHKYDCRASDIFDLQDDLTGQIVRVVAPAVLHAEQHRLLRSRPQSLDAWECVQRGMTHLHGYDLPSTREARRLFERAIELDPTYSRAFLGLAFSHHREVQFNLVATREESIAKCVQAARRAVELDESDAFARWERAVAHLFCGENEEALAEARLSAELNPNYANAHVVVGFALALMGRAEEGIPLLEAWGERNLHDPANSINLGHLATAYFAAGRYDRAVNSARRATERRADNPQPHLVLAASLALSGRAAEASEALDRAERLCRGCAQPGAWWFRFSNAQDNARLLGGLRQAGLPA
jgi:adenylate cyclase